MSTTLFIRNVLRLSDRGEGDGNVYATASGAAPDPEDRTFVLAGMSIAPDLGADADDKFIGHVLYFPASGNRYQIVDWVAATDQATVWENPAVGDTGACEVRRALVNRQQLPANPSFRLADGQRGFPWKSSAPTTIEAHLPNRVTNGGFEIGLLTPWTATAAGTGVAAVNASSPILGARDLTLSLGDQAAVSVKQTLLFMRKKGRYRLMFKAKHTGTFVPNEFEAIFAGAGVDLVLSSPSSGSVSGTVFRPALSTTAGWHWVDVTVPDWTVRSATLELKLSGAFDVNVDEVYLFEQIPVSALLIFDHSGSTALTNVMGRRVSKDRTGSVLDTDHFQLLGAQTMTGGEVGMTSFAAAVFPIYTLESADLVEAGEILLSETFAWTFDPEPGYDPDLVETDESVNISAAGLVTFDKYSEARSVKGTYRYVPDGDMEVFRDRWYPHHHQVKHPFGYRFGDQRPMLVVDMKNTFGLFYDGPVLQTLEFEYRQVVK